MFDVKRNVGPIIIETLVVNILYSEKYPIFFLRGNKNHREYFWTLEKRSIAWIIRSYCLNCIVMAPEVTHIYG